MKLRNKKTGEIKEYGSVGATTFAEGGALEAFAVYNSLADLNEEWEDYEEPKDFWFIDTEVLIACEYTEPLLCDKKVAIETMKQIGNYFDTREEAEKAVEKLKAWKRLKDKGFRFVKGWLDNNDDFILKAKLGTVGLIDQPDVNLLFGGEDE